MKKFKWYLVLFLSVLFINESSSQIIISEVADGTNGSTTGYPRYVELSNESASSIDLNGYMIIVHQSGISPVTYTFPSYSLPAGECIVVTNIDNSTVDQRWTDYNLTAPDYVIHGETATMNKVNGNDVVELQNPGATTIDLYGEIGINGLGTAWEYTDSYAYRDLSINSPNSVFTLSEWVIPGIDVLDGLGEDLSAYLTPGYRILLSGTDIISFSFPTQTGPATINDVNHTVDIEVTFESDITYLGPTIEVSPGATIDPISGEPYDFTNPKTFTVTAQNSDQQDWIVTVTKEAFVNDSADILTFYIPEQTGQPLINSLAQTIDVTVLNGSNLASLTPAFTISTGAISTPLSDVAQDFSSPVLFTVTAEDAITQKIWTVTVTEESAQSTEADITSFILAEQVSDATINDVANTVEITVPYGTNVTNLTPTISISAGASINPGSGIAQDFSSPIQYTVTAQDAITQKIWTVTVIVESLNSILTGVPDNLSGFSYEIGSGPSTEQSYVLSGSELDGTDVIITPTTNYEISLTSGSGFDVTPITLSAFDGTPTTVYVRLVAGLAINTYNGEIISNAGGGATTLDVTCNGEVTAVTPPTIVITPSDLSGFTYEEGAGPSIEQSYIVSGTNLNSTDVIITPLSNYEFSFVAVGGYVSSPTTLTLPSFDGTPTTIYVRLVAGLVAGTYNGEVVTHIGGGATQVDLTCNGVVTVPGASGCASDLFISEYHEPLAGNNKGVEIYNGTGNPVDLSNYWVGKVANDATDVEGSINLAGTLNDGETVCVYNELDGDLTFNDQGDINIPWTGANWNGDDAVYLLKGGNTLGFIIDAIGDLPPMADPGTEYLDNGVSTLNSTLVRKSTVTDPTTTWSGLEWDMITVSTYTDWGIHTLDCGGTPTPTLVVSTTDLIGFTYEDGSGPSAEQSFDISGTNLDGSDVIITPPTNYEISLTSGTGFALTPITLSAFDGTPTTVYVQLSAGLAVGTYNSELITSSGGGATSVDVTCSGEVTAVVPPTIVVSVTDLTGFTYEEGSGPSAEQSYDISGTNLDLSDVIITPPANYEISLTTSTGFALTPITLSAFDGTSTTIFVRLAAGLAIATYNSELIVNAGGGATSVDVTCSGEVTAISPATINVSTADLNGFTYQEAAGPSAEQSYDISGTNLDLSDVIITPPTNYEISLTTGTGFALTPITLSAYDGSLTTVFVRLVAGLAINTYNGEVITNTGGGASQVDITCNGEVTAVSAGGCSSDLFISEYHEPDGGNNKGVEIYNGTGNPVDLSNYWVGKVANDATDVEGSINLAGTLNDGETVCVYNELDGDLTFNDQGNINIPWTGANWNGDDAVYLLKGGNTLGFIIDAIGDLPPMADPGTEYLDNGVSTLNSTLVRKNTVTDPTTTWSGLEWDMITVSTYTDWGMHTQDCGGSPTPTLIVSTPSLAGFTYEEGSGPSTEQSFDISGNNLDLSDVIITPPANYEISLISGTGFALTPITLSAFDGTPTTVYVQLSAGLAVGTYNSELITSSGGGATSVDVTCSGEVTAVVPPTIVVSVSDLTGFTYEEGSGPSAEQSYDISGTNLDSSDVIITPPANYEISLTTGTGFALTPITLSAFDGTPTTIFVRLAAGLAIATYNSELIANSGGGATTVDVTCSGEVTAVTPPTLIVSTTDLTGLNYDEGAGPSAEQSYDISGTNLDGSDVIITPPANFEISLTSGTGFALTPITLSTYDGTTTTVYVRLVSGLVFGIYNNETISHTGGNATQVDVNCNGEVFEVIIGECPTELLISEYHEPDGGNNKGIEIYNGTGGPIDLADYYVGKVSNDATDVEGNIQLAGILNDGETVCVYNESDGDMTFNDQGDINIPWPGATWNGNDAVYLLKGGTTLDFIIDAIGAIPPLTAPATEYLDNGISTLNTGIVRKSYITTPTTTWSGLEWDMVAPGTYTGWGTHTITCEVNIDEARKELAGINIYPNPNNGNFTIETGDFSTSEVHIYDCTAKLIKVYKPTDNLINVNINNTGIYMVKIISSDDVFSKKIIVVE